MGEKISNSVEQFYSSLIENEELRKMKFIVCWKKVV